MKISLTKLTLIAGLFTSSGFYATAQTADQTLCEETGVKRYSVTSQLQGSAYNWTVSVQSGSGTAPTPTVMASDTVAAPNGSSAILINWTSAQLPGDYLISVTETSSDGCAGDPKSFVVRIVDKPVATITYFQPAPVCYGSNTDVEVTITEGSPTYTLDWTVEYKDDAGTTIGTVQTGSQSGIAGPTYTIPTTFPASNRYTGGTITVKLTNVTDVNSVYCSAGTLGTPSVATITVNPDPNTSGITAE